MQNFWLTIITITKNDHVGLVRTLASTAALRSLSGVEQIVVYAGDVAPVICDSAVYLSRQRSAGIAGAFNEGLNQARGEWVWFLNGGDCLDARLDQDFLHTLLEKATEDVIIGGITYEGNSALHPLPPPAKRWPAIRPWIPHPSTLVRRCLFEKFGRFDEHYSIAMDYEWWLRALGPKVPVCVLDMPFSVFSPGGISQRPEMRQQILREKWRAVRRHGFSISYQLVRVWFLTFLTHDREPPARLP